MAKTKPKLLVLTLFSGENEYGECIKQLQTQSYKNWEHIVFHDMENKNGHDTLYKFIMDNENQYDLFMKLDADIVLKEDYSLENIVNFFNENPDIDQANFSVIDVMSGLHIMGILVFTNKARWLKTDEILFVDHTPTIPGMRLLVWDKPAPVAFHCPNPSTFQAFHFGVHRAFKAIQKDRRKNWIQSALQWHFLMCVWKKYEKTKDRIRAMILLGALCVYHNKLDLNSINYQDKGLKKQFIESETLCDEEIYRKLEGEWKRVINLNHKLYILLWPKIVEYKLQSRLRTWIICNRNNYLDFC